MKRFNKLIGFIVVLMVMMVAFCSVSFAATVGQQLTAPETGWQRIDDKDSKFVYSGSWKNAAQSGADWREYDFLCDDAMGISSPESTIKFKIYSNKLRILTFANVDQSGYWLKIDGVSVGNIKCNYNLVKGQVLTYENLNLGDGYHVIEMGLLQRSVFNATNEALMFDAIDIDATGSLVPFSPTLSATLANKTVELSWTFIPNATYNVYRSTTPGAYDVPIASNITNTAYIDMNVSYGTTYYYVVSAVVNGTESSNSNEASATPVAPPNSGILEITMTNGQIKEYDLTGSELQSFLTWYDNRSSGTGKAYFTITKKNAIKPFLSRKEYLSFDKISSFEVNEYTE